MLSENYSKARHSKARHGKPRNRQQSAPQQETFRGEKVFALLFLVLLLAFSGLNLARNGQKLWQDAAGQDWREPQQAVQQLESELNEELLLHYPMLDAYGILQRAMGKQEENAFDTVRDKKGFLYGGNFWNGFGDDCQQLALRTKRLAGQLKEQGTEFGVILFPMNLPQQDAAYAGIPYTDFTEVSDRFAAWSRYYGLKVLDLRDNWRQAGLTQEEAFFRTDHHWTPRAAFEGYCTILRWMQSAYGLGISEPRLRQLCRLENYQQVTYEKIMIGSYGRETGLLFAGGPEDYTVIFPKEEGDYLLRTGTLEEYDEYEGSFSEALLDTDYHFSDLEDMYEGQAENTYLHGSVSDYASILNRQASLDKKVLLLRDSYATPVGAFLAQSFAQIDMLWIGQYTPEQIQEYLAENHYDYVFLSLYPEDIREDFFPFGMEESAE